MGPGGLRLTGLFERFEIRQQVVNLVGRELELRHRRMPGGDAFRKGLAEGLDRVSLMQRPERRRRLERTLTGPTDRMASSAVGPREHLAALFGRRGCDRRAYQHQHDKSLAEEGSAENGLRHLNWDFPMMRKG